MSDSIFDDLDKTVDDLVADGNGSQSADDNNISAESARPKTTDLNTESSKSQNMIATNKPPQRHFRGQFMDMIHPSGDVAVSNKSNDAVERLNDAIRNSKQPPDEDGAKNPEDPAADAVENSLDIEISNDDDNPTEEPSQEKLAEERPDDAYTSPFLPDAKVEKRPLGMIDEGEMPEALLPVDDGGQGEPEPRLSGGDDDTESMLDDAEKISDDAEEPKQSKGPDEISEKPDTADFFAMETEDQAKETSEESDSTEQDAIQDNAETQKANDTPLSSLSSKNTGAALANAMIMPQYKPSAPTKSQMTEPGTLYAAAATGPLKTKRRKLPIWIWILIYILLLAIGVVLGAGLYYSGWIK